MNMLDTSRLKPGDVVYAKFVVHDLGHDNSTVISVKRSDGGISYITKGDIATIIPIILPIENGCYVVYDNQKIEGKVIFVYEDEKQAWVKYNTSQEGVDHQVLPLSRLRRVSL